ncbi:MAG TPA: beta-ketoacyl-[acyl-carrier-protein] synthase family protein [Abditibacteriaceae bacterium]|jgi:3-oxoacyl-(acyl-carrier-protein) synthase
MNRRIFVTQWHCAAPFENQWREWNEADSPLRLWSESGSMTGGAPFPFGGAAFESVSNRAVAHFQLDNIAPTRLALCLVSSKPDFLAFQNGDWRMCDAPLVWWRERTGARGIGYTPVAACASGAHALALGAQLLETNQADAVLCGGWEAPHSDFILAGYQSLGALSQGTMKPFDAARDGFVPQSGSALLLLESEESATRRGMKSLATFSGHSMLSDATAMTTMQPSGDSIARAIEGAVGSKEISYINAHGTATKLNDVIETRGIRNVFGKAVPVSSTKPITGHWLGAAGALEAIIAVQSVRENWLSPTLNTRSPDTDCDLDYILNAGKNTEVRAALSLSYGFGGHIGALVFEK